MGGYRNIPKINALKLDNFSHLVKMGEYYINQFCLEYKIDDISKISENRFKACLTYIYNHYYKLSLYTDKKRAPAIDNVIDYTDIGQLNAILQAFLYLCNVCDKIPSLNGFSMYCGIPIETFIYWYNDYINDNIYNTDLQDDSINNEIDIYNNILNPNNNTINTDTDFINTIKSIKDKSLYRKALKEFRYKIYKCLKDSKENALADRLASGGNGLIGTIAVLNHQYGWDTDKQDIIINQPQISLADLPKLEGSPTQKD